MNKNIITKILTGALALSTAFAMSGCGIKTASNSDLEYLKGKGEMVVGYTLFAPMNYKGDDGELTGFETDFATAVCEKIGVKPKFQEIDWDSKEVELYSKSIDCIWNGMTITDERKSNMSISMPYMENRQVLIVKNENKDKYSSSLDGAKIVAEAGSAGEELVTGNDSFKSGTFTAVDSQAKALMEVASNVSDVAVIDYIMSIGSIGEGTDYTDLTVIDNNYEGETYGVAFRKNSDVTEAVDKAMKELEADGTLAKIAEKYKLESLITVK